VSDGAAEAIGRPLRDLRTALDDERPAAAIGAAKELVEAACKVVLAANGQLIGTRDSLPAMFSEARRVVGLGEGDLGRSLAATVDRLGRLRNAAGSGHGHAEAPTIGMAEARLAASSANGLVSYLLAYQPAGRAREDSNL